MSAAEFFLDTNILVYTFDQTAPAKQTKAQALLEQALTAGCRVLYSEDLQHQQQINTLTILTHSPS